MGMIIIAMKLWCRNKAAVSFLIFPFICPDKLDNKKVYVKDFSLGKMWWSLKRPILLAELRHRRVT